ncbi:NADH-quinone oxidoreductase subunit M [Brevibacillus fulvus]
MFTPKQMVGTIKTIGVLGTLLPLIMSLMLFAGFDYSAGLQFIERRDWIKIPIGLDQNGSLTFFPIRYEMGIDGASMPLLLLTAIIGTLAAVGSWQMKRRLREYFILYHLLLIGMFGVFSAQNLFLFFLFFELTLIPVYFLLGIWGYAERERAANKFLLYNGIGSAILLLAFIAIFVQLQTVNFGELQQVLTNPDDPLSGYLSPEYRYGLFVALFIAFGIKLPIFPFHSWMLNVHVQAPPPVVMIHSAILLKMGAYGLLRIGINFFPDQAYEFSVWLAVFGLINIFYGAVLATVQKDLKMVLAYSSISHMGMVLLGFAAMNSIGFQGAIFQLVSHGLISALLFFIVGVIWDRTGTSTITELGGIAKSMPFISGVFLAGALASLGLPGMSGFISEFLALMGLFGAMPLHAAIGAIGLIFTTIYVLRAVLRAVYGPTPSRLTRLADAQPMEAIPLVVLLGVIILIGIYPAVLSDPLQKTLDSIVPVVTGIGG